MPPRRNENPLTAKLGIDYPTIQGPLGGLSSQKLTAAVSNFGGLGSFGAHGLASKAIKDVIAQIRSVTLKPFAMNLWSRSFRKSGRPSSGGAQPAVQQILKRRKGEWECQISLTKL
jgi:nitronate monooxygenase